MLAISTWHPSSSTSHAVKCELHSNLTECLVVAKVNRLEVYDLTPDGLVRKTSFDTWGTITSLAAFRRTGREFASLSVTTDHLKPQFLVLDYDSRSAQLVVTNSISLLTPSGRPSEYYNGAVVHPDGRVAACLVYVGTIRIVVFGSKSIIEAEFDCRIPELNVLSICFLPSSEGKYVLSILHQDHTERRKLLCRELDIEEKEILPEPSHNLLERTVNEIAETLIPVSFASTKAVIVCGDGECSIFTVASAKGKGTGGKRLSRNPPHDRQPTPIDLWGTITFSFIDSYRIVLVDGSGRLGMLIITQSALPQATTSLNLTYLSLGEVNPASCIVHISGPTFYIGSHFGDSQIIRIFPNEAQDTGRIEVLESFTNVAPIMDAILSDPENTGQAQVVACSGGSSSGSLQLIRAGGEFKQTAILKSQLHVTNIFPLRLSYDISNDSLLLISTPFGTRIWEVNPEGAFQEQPVEDLPAFSRSKPTLASCTLQRLHCAVQVTSERLIIVDFVMSVEVARWPLEGVAHIVAAAANPTQVVLALQGGKLLLFSTQADLKLVSERQLDLSDGLPREVSSLAINPVFGTNTLSTSLVAVGFWDSNAVVLFSLPSFQYPSDNPDPWVVEEAHAPRSLILHSFGASPSYLLIGLANGTVVSYSVNQSGLSSKQTFALGSFSAVKLTSCSSLNNVKGAVLAVGDRAGLIWQDKGRLKFSNVALKEVSAVASFNTPAYPTSVICASLTGKLVIGKIGEFDKINIRTVPLGRENPQKIACHSDLKIYGVGCLRIDRDAPAGTEAVTSSIRFYDAISMEFLSSFICGPGEEICSVQSLELTTLNSSEPADKRISEHFVIGTARAALPGNQESIEGRILVFGGTHRERPYVIASVEVPGCVYSLAALDGRIAAAVNTSVFLYQLKENSDAKVFKISEVAKWNKGYLINSIISSYGKLIISDALRSVDVLKFIDGKLQDVARDRASLWPVGIQTIGDHMIIGAEMDLNLFLMMRSEGALELIGGVHFGEMVNKFVPVGREKVLLFTSSGRIAIVTKLEEELSFRLTSLQRNLGYVIKGPGGRDHAEWRTPISSKGPSLLSGFIDGDFLERFMDLGATDVEKVEQGRNEFERIKLRKDDLAGIMENISSPQQVE